MVDNNFTIDVMFATNVDNVVPKWGWNMVVLGGNKIYIITSNLLWPFLKSRLDGVLSLPSNNIFVYNFIKFYCIIYFNPNIYFFIEDDIFVDYYLFSLWIVNLVCLW